MREREKKNLFLFIYLLVVFSPMESNLAVTSYHLCTCAFPSPALVFSSDPQVAIIAGNFDLAEIIKVHKASDVGKLTAMMGSLSVL